MWPRERARLGSDAEGGEEGLLWDLHPPYLLHPTLAGFLALEELALAGDVPAVALGGHVLAVGAHRLAGDYPASHRCLHRHLELLAGYEFLEPLDQGSGARVRLLAVDDYGERVHRLPGDQDIYLDEVCRLVAHRLVVVGGVTPSAALEGVEEVGDDLRERQVVGELHPTSRDVLDALRDAAPLVAEAHHGAYVLLRRDDGRPYDGLPDLLERLGQVTGVRDL